MNNNRLKKADAKQSVSSIKNPSRIGAPYAMLLYERFLGRPFKFFINQYTKFV
jgi:hypothetical protein